MDAQTLQYPAVRPDHGGKEHFEVLDGLRGVAALLVVLFHIRIAASPVWPDALHFSHAYLPVDLFFVLSGFVIAHAYGQRIAQLGVRQFMLLRLVRLHPLVILGVLLGLCAYLFSPFAELQQKDESLFTVGAAAASHLVMLPGPLLAGHEIKLFPLNGPLWSLALEYLASLLFALILYRQSLARLAAIAALCALGLVIYAQMAGSLEIGWGRANAAGGLLRIGYSFVVGLILYRLRHRIPRMRLGFGALSAILLFITIMPVWPVYYGLDLNGIYDAVAVIVLFPLLVLAGANAVVKEGEFRLGNALGRLSYPIYVVHAPMIVVWGEWLKAAQAPMSTALFSALMLVAWTVLVAHIAEKHWDRPLRSALNGHLRNRSRAQSAPAA